MAAPMLDPQLHASAGVPGSADYQPGQRVWVHRDGSWRPGVVLQCSPRAVAVRYRPADGSGTGVDTVTRLSLAARADRDPCLDEAMPGRAIRTT
jgi:hypothetical protein